MMCTGRLRWVVAITLTVICASGISSATIQKRAVQDLATTQEAAKLNVLARGLSDMNTFMGPELDPFLKVRVAGTPGNVEVRQHIVKQLSDMSAGWTIDLDSFTDSTPLGRKPFTNVIATLNPRAPRRLVLACHFDSKLRDFKFVAATDSAVPCAMLIHLARKFNRALQHRRHRLDTTLQLIFFDGEEAFVSWSATDSIYGARHLAAKMAQTPHPQYPSMNELQAMDVFVLLDLLGSANPTFHNYFSQTSQLFKSMQSIENRLRDMNLLASAGRHPIFTSLHSRGRIEDDHIPFLNRGVPILHLISSPFPRVWHKESDTKVNLDVNTIDNLNRILRVFVSEYLDL